MVKTKEPLEMHIKTENQTEDMDSNQDSAARSATTSTNSASESFSNDTNLIVKKKRGRKPSVRKQQPILDENSSSSSPFSSAIKLENGSQFLTKDACGFKIQSSEDSESSNSAILNSINRPKQLTKNLINISGYSDSADESLQPRPLRNRRSLTKPSNNSNNLVNGEHIPIDNNINSDDSSLKIPIILTGNSKRKSISSSSSTSQSSSDQSNTISEIITDKFIDTESVQSKTNNNNEIQADGLNSSPLTKDISEKILKKETSEIEDINQQPVAEKITQEVDIKNSLIGPTNKKNKKNSKVAKKNSDKENITEKSNHKNDKDDQNDDKVADEDETDQEDDDEDEKQSVLEDLEYLQLQSGNESMKKENVCDECELSLLGPGISCQGTCLKSFHLDCIKIDCSDTDSNTTIYKCKECITGLHTCFVCNKTPTENSTTNITKKCSSNKCGKYFHEECAKSNQLFRKDTSNPNNIRYFCSLHTCLTCWIDTRSNSMLNGNSQSSSLNIENYNQNAAHQSMTAFKGRFMKCIRCPTAYHVGDFCIAAGSTVLSGCNIICPNHFKQVKGFANHNKVSVNWCFVCCKANNLIGCNRCPAAYHYECINNPSEDLKKFILNKRKSTLNDNQQEEQEKSIQAQQQNSPTSSVHSSMSSITMNSTNSKAESILSIDWTCEDCLLNKRLLYGQIVWAKVGSFRWWPAQICHPRRLPDNVVKKPHQTGEFAVHFFGSYDYSWTNIGRCFVFAEGDEAYHQKCKLRKALEAAFKIGVQQAQLAFKEVERLRMERTNKIIGSKDTLKSAKSNFQIIKVSKPFGNVTFPRVPIDDLPKCDCDPKSPNPCGTDECMNRILKYECHPSVCPAKERCQNQRFVKRIYPKVEPVNTGDRGWGLRSLVEIKKGEFVNEYVGEIIDGEECKRRLELAYQNDIFNFYFLTIDSKRVIDAGPKGNLSRFINHSCGPNLETQKWLVNGDTRVGLFAIQDIPANTELTFNYMLDCLSNEKAVCKCGAKNCSGFIGARPKNSNNDDNSSSFVNTNSSSISTNNLNNSVNGKKRKLSETNTLKNPRRRSKSTTPNLIDKNDGSSKSII